MNEWQEHISLLKEDANFKKRIRSYIKDRHELLGVGAQENSAPYTQKMQTHVTFDKQLEEEIEIDMAGFRIHDELDSQMWKDDKLHDEIRAKLIEIAKDFIEGLPIDVQIEDITLTGSLANYNWSKHSDVDLHIVANFLKIDENIELVKAFFDAHRMRWNDLHDIKIKGYDVEVYVENKDEEHHSTGVYSITNGEWATHPEQIDRVIDLETALKKANDIDEQTNAVRDMFKEGEYEKVMRNVDRIKNKIRSMRSAGLESEEMEFSPENIAFKMLRRAKVLNKLTRLKYNAYDKSKTLDD